MDNSGDTSHYEWVTNASSSGVTTYNHWNIRGADWIGKFNHVTKQHESVNNTNFIHSVQVVHNIIEMYKDNPVVIGIEPCMQLLINKIFVFIITIF